MSLAPLIDPRIRGVAGARASDMNPMCCAPGCNRPSQHGHHLWARSFLRGQPTEWVGLPDGTIFSNVVGLCVGHHNDVTGGVGGHKAMIRLEPGNEFIWLRSSIIDGNPVWLNDGALTPQPFKAVKDGNLESQVEPHHVDLAEGQRCESCGYEKPTKRKPGPKRKTQTWGVVVPDDSEDGAEILDTLVEQIAAYMGLSDATAIRKIRYFVIEHAMQFVVANAPLFISDMEGEGG